MNATTATTHIANNSVACSGTRPVREGAVVPGATDGTTGVCGTEAYMSPGARVCVLLLVGIVELRPT